MSQVYSRILLEEESLACIATIEKIQRLRYAHVAVSLLKSFNGFKLKANFCHKDKYYWQSVISSCNIGYVNDDLIVSGKYVFQVNTGRLVIYELGKKSVRVIYKVKLCGDRWFCDTEMKEDFICLNHSLELIDRAHQKAEILLRSYENSKRKQKQYNWGKSMHGKHQYGRR